MRRLCEGSITVGGFSAGSGVSIAVGVLCVWRRRGSPAAPTALRNSVKPSPLRFPARFTPVSSGSVAEILRFIAGVPC